VESNQIDIFAWAVFCDLEQIDDTEKTGLARQGWSDIRKTDGGDGVHFDFAFFHAVAVAHFDVEALPYSDTAGDVSAAHAVAKPLGEYHEESLQSWETGGASILQCRKGAAQPSKQTVDSGDMTPE
jgi:hypothetical protein